MPDHFQHIHKIVFHLLNGCWSSRRNCQSIIKTYQFLPPFKNNNKVIWNNLIAKINAEKNNKPVQSNIVKIVFNWKLSAAAVLIIFFSLFSLYNKYNKNPQLCITQKGELRTILLPDSSEVILNSETQILYIPKKWDQSRKIYLKGEAFFKVKKGSYFIVNTNIGNVKVIGTSFNIYARKAEFEVSCHSGKVEVSINKSKNISLLTPGLSVKYIDDKLSKPNEFNTIQVIGWQKGEFSFHNTPLYRVLEEIERQFNVTFEKNGIENRSYSGYFNTKDLLEALDLVCLPMQLKYKIINQAIIQISK